MFSNKYPCWNASSIPSPNWSKYTAEPLPTPHPHPLAPSAIKPGCGKYSGFFNIPCSWMLGVLMGVASVNVWPGPLSLLTLCQRWASAVLGPADSAQQGSWKVQYSISSACQCTGVLLTVSAISLVTICTCLERPRVDVCSWGAYSRPMHAEGNHWERRETH